MSEASPNFVLDSERLKRVVAERDALKARIKPLLWALNLVDERDPEKPQNWLHTRESLVKVVAAALAADLDQKREG